jgi:hypothetical protein
MAVAGLVMPLMAVAVMTSCVPTARIVRESSAPRPPDWAGHPPPEGDGRLYFVGLNSGAESLESGQRSAIDDALTKVSGYIGVDIEARSSSYMDEVRQHITEQIRSRTSAKVHGCSIVDWYYEKLTRIGDSAALSKYDVYVLVAYDKNAAAAERRRQAAQNGSLAHSALKLFSQARSATSRGRPWEAARLYAQADGILRTLSEPANFEREEFKDTTELASAVADRARETSEVLHSFVYRVDLSGPPKAAQAFRAALTSVLSKGGYSETENSAALVLRGEVALAPGAILMNSNVYSALGRISVVRAEDQYSLATVEVEAKGLQRDPLQAAVNAADDGGSESGQDLLKALSEIR